MSAAQVAATPSSRLTRKLARKSGPVKTCRSHLSEYAVGGNTIATSSLNALTNITRNGPSMNAKARARIAAGILLALMS